MSVIAKFRLDRQAQASGNARMRTPADTADAPVLSNMDRSVRVRRITPVRIAIAAALLLVLAAGVYGYLRFGLTRSLSVSLDRVTISEVRQAPFDDYVPVTGNVAPRNTVFLDTVEGGQVTEVLVEDGAVAKAGEVLARLKNTRLELEVIGLGAQITQQENLLASARLTFQQSELRNSRDLMAVQRDIDRTADQLAREKPLEKEGVAIATIRNLEADLKRLQAEKDAIVQSADGQRELGKRTLQQIQSSTDGMTSSLALVRESLSNLNLSAPIAGQLTGFNLNIGQVVNPGQRIGQLDSIDDYKITAMVDEFYLGRLAIGQKGSVEIAGKTWQLKVAKIYPDVRERQFQVDLAFDGATPEGMRRGQSMRPRVELGETAASLTIANGPFYDETGGQWVMVLTKDGSSASRRSVTLGRRNPDAIEVVSGLAPGEKVITSSYQAFKDMGRVDFN